MVRPLIKVQSQSELASLLGSQPVSDNTRRLCAALIGYAVVLVLTDSVMSAYVMVCTETGAGYNVAETDSVEVITPLMDLPCSAEVIADDTINDELRGLVSNVAELGGWSFGKFDIYEREDYSAVSLTCKLE